MGLSQSLYTGYSGMATHQRSMDNASNNLANINTVGFKKSDFLFSNLFSKVISGAMGAEETHGSINGVNVGLGVSTGAILSNFRQGPLETTGNPLDVAISGNGFFLASTPYGTAMTRSGSFYLDHTINPQQRLLCVGDGLLVQGWMAQNGVVTPSATIGDITLPAIGDLLPGKVTTEVDLTGILPTNQSDADFNGRETLSIELKGNLSPGENRIGASLYAAVNQTDGVVSTQGQIKEIPVEITFSGPTVSPDGSLNQFAWSMATVNWPNPGDPSVTIYSSASGLPMADFFTSGSTELNRGAGQTAVSYLRPGSTTVQSVTASPDGGSITTTFKLSDGLTLDVSRLTNLQTGAPGGGPLEVWHVDGNPKGSIARTVTVYDEYTAFVEKSDAAGNTLILPERRVQAREDTLFFTKISADASGTEWAWRSSIDNAAGALKFNTSGELVSATQPQGGINYDFNGVSNINYAGSLQASAQNGYLDGTLNNISIDQNGKIFGHYSNNVSEVLAMLAMGTVPNPSGLEGRSGALFYPGSASGALMVGVAGDADGAYGIPAIGAGYLSSGCLEGSNVALSEEFTGLINTERGYQLNSRVVTTSDEMLQTALQLKR